MAFSCDGLRMSNLCSARQNARNLPACRVCPMAQLANSHSSSRRLMCFKTHYSRNRHPNFGLFSLREHFICRAGGPGQPAEGVTLLAYDDEMLKHREVPVMGGAAHVERPERISSIMDRLQAAGLLERCTQVKGHDVDLDLLERIHDPDLLWVLRSASSLASHRLRKFQKSPEAGGGAVMYQSVDEDEEFSEIRYMAARYIRDCPVNEASYICARLAAGTAAHTALAVFRGEARNGAAIIRPPGHHAESSLAMGFCFFNNAAVAAQALRLAGARRVLIMDWDIHHGNGTQHIFYDTRSVMYCSTHRHDGGLYFPGTGAAHKHGEGFNVNVPWDGPGVHDGDCLSAFRHVVIPIAKEFDPDFVIISAGFDAAPGDPLGGCEVSPQAFAHMTHMLTSLAPTVLLLEGGYNLDITAKCTEQCVRVLLGDVLSDLPDAKLGPSEQGRKAILEALEAHVPFWQSARAEMDQLKREWQFSAI